MRKLNKILLFGMMVIVLLCLAGCQINTESMVDITSTVPPAFETSMPTITPQPTITPTPVPVTPTPVVVTATPTQEIVTPEVTIITPAPATPTPIIITATTEPVQVTPEVIIITPVPATPTPVIVTATPVPVTPTPVIVTATPVPVTPTPIVIVVTAAPVTATPVVITATPIPVVTATLVPITPTPKPTATPTPRPTATPKPVPTENPGVANLAKIKKELSKISVSNEILPSAGGNKKWDLYNSIDTRFVNEQELYNTLETLFVKCIAHSVKITFSYDGSAENRLVTSLNSAVCSQCGRLMMTYKSGNTNEMSNLMSQISNVAYANNIMLDFLNEHTVKNDSNSNERLTIVCDGH